MILFALVLVAAPLELYVALKTPFPADFAVAGVYFVALALCTARMINR